MRRLVVIPDSHHPYQDERACDVVLQAAEGFTRGHDKVIVTLGDQIDCYSVSAHSKDPRRKQCLDDEILSCAKWLDAIGKIGPAEKHYIAGNHEYRLERYLMDHAPALFETVKIEKLLRLKDKGWSYTPYKKGRVIGKAYYTHDLGQAGIYAYMRARVRYGGNVIIGHTHYAGVSYMGTAKGETHVGISAGWLGSVDAIDYTTAVNASEWVHSFLIGYLEDSGITHFQLIPIIKGRCVIEGKVYK